jgi:hypothetical protein
MQSKIPLWILHNSQLLKDEDFICQNLEEYNIKVGGKLLTEFPSSEEINSYEQFKIVLALIKYFDIPYPITIFSFLLDNKEESLSLLQKLKQDLPPFEQKFYDSLINFLNSDDKYKYALKEKCLDKLELFMLLHKKGYPFNARTCSNAVINGQLDCLKYARENGCPWNTWTCTYAAKYGHIECLKYARENGCPWNEVTCFYAADNGHLTCLKYARENGCPWDKWTCVAAAKYGHLLCLKYARENGCSWDSSVCSHAAGNGQIECLKYARENGCPCPLASSRREGCVNMFLCSKKWTSLLFKICQRKWLSLSSRKLATRGMFQHVLMQLKMVIFYV